MNPPAPSLVVIAPALVGQISSVGVSRWWLLVPIVLIPAISGGFGLWAARKVQNPPKQKKKHGDG